MAEDLGESYDRHSAPIGASYHDYEEPLSSYERQCLDAGEDPDEGREEGWGPDLADEANAAPALDEGMGSTELAGEGTWDSGDGDWDSRFVDDDGVQRSATSSKADECSEKEKEDEVSSKEEERSGSEVGITLPPLENNILPHTAVETRNTIPASSTTSTEILSPDQISDNHIEAPQPSTSPTKTPLPPTANDRKEPPAPQSTPINWADGLDYSHSKNKAKAVRAYDEFKQGIRPRHGNRWINRFKRDFTDSKDNEDERQDGEEHDYSGEEDDDADEDDEGMDDEDMPFIRIPWPETEHDEVTARREDAAVVEIRVGDEETLESILRDIEGRAERRRKGKGVEIREVGVGGLGEEGRAECPGQEGTDIHEGQEVKVWW